MEIKQSSIKRMCSFYASDWHLTTMMLPYVAKLAEKDVQIETILEHGIEENIKELISKLNMKSDLKQKILKINWSKTEKEDIKNQNNNVNNQKIILINGTKERIKQVNNLLEEELNVDQKEKLTIINCYEVDDIKEQIQEILNVHDNIINTSGQYNVKEIFCI